MFKLLTQEKLQRQDMIMLDLVPMVKQRPDRSSPWLFTHREGTDPSSVQSFNISQSANNLFSLRPDPIINNVYYTPESRDQGAFDSFIMANGWLFIFQFTISFVKKQPSQDVLHGDEAEEELGLARLVSSYTLPHQNSQPGRRGRQTARSKMLSRRARDTWSSHVTYLRAMLVSGLIR